jgi:hypothetical protein
MMERRWTGNEDQAIAVLMLIRLRIFNGKSAKPPICHHLISHNMSWIEEHVNERERT